MGFMVSKTHLGGYSSPQDSTNSKSLWKRPWCARSGVSARASHQGIAILQQLWPVKGCIIFIWTLVRAKFHCPDMA